MYKKIIKLSILFLISATHLQGQSLTQRATDAKKNIMIVSAEFLVDATAADKTAPKKICESCSDISSIKKFVADNGVKSGGQLIDKWVSWKLDTTNEDNGKTSLKAFADKVDSSLTSKHSDRKALGSYNHFITRMADIKIEPPTAITNDSQKNADEEGADLADEVKQSTQGPVKTNKGWITPTNIAYAELILIILLLIILIYKALGNDKGVKRFKGDLNRIRKERDQLRHDIENLRSDLRESSELREEDRSALAKLKEELTTAALKQTEVEEAVSNTIEWDKPAAPQKVQEVFYSRYADLEGGFSAVELLPREDSDTIFEITILSPNKASFRVSGNLAAQKYALSNADYFLEPTCHYDTLPAGTIINEKPGLLVLTGGKWEIKEKAKISFR